MVSKPKVMKSISLKFKDEKMKRYLKRTGQELYLDGFHLLALCQKLIREMKSLDAQGNGTPKQPYIMTSPEQWISRWRASGKEANKYYKLAGRLILKNHKLYVGDIGPAYLQGTSREDALNKAKTQYLKNTSPSEHPNMATANFNTDAESAWLKINTMDDPTYRSGAQRILDPGLIYEASSKTLEKMGGGRPAPWTEVRYSSGIAQSIRTLLKGEKLALGFNNGKYDRHYSRKQFMLPVFTTAIFHAEPARNERAWPINLMLLDLAQAKTEGFSWDAILWHPQGINFIPNSPVQGLVKGPRGKNADQRDMVNITNTDKLHLVGGILPASPTGGGERAKGSLFKEAKPLHPRAIERGQVQGPGIIQKVPFDYIHQKEIDVLLTWLLRFPKIISHWSIVYDTSIGDEHLINPSDVLSAENTNPLTAQGLKAIKSLIEERCTSFDYMI
ncbi:hypothetical protein MED121_16569 [Marinomonas sp. MED121]|nr:hypothetical protein MED121_16569 [Marinomonas sp. MED121]